jgi:hypothetical protein
MEIQPKVALGTAAGIVAGAWIVTAKSAHVYALLNPLHGIVFEIATVIAAYFIHKAVELWYGARYENVPDGIKVLTSMSISTLFVGTAAASCVGVPIPIDIVVNLFLGSLTFGGIGYALGKYATEDVPPTPPPAASAPPRYQMMA